MLTTTTIALVMIVKNEARGIVATLESVRDAIDHWLILDTGSTDETQGLIHRAMVGLPGFLAEEPFVDFATTRNRALELLDEDFEPRGSFDYGPERSVWRFMISGDAVVENASALRDIVALAEERGMIACAIPIRGGGLEYHQIMLTKRGAGCSFGGVTHEAMRVPDSRRVLDVSHARELGLFVRYEHHGETKTARWQLDVELLERELAGLTDEERRTKPREVFYLAQSYECLGNYDHAAQIYTERVFMGGFAEERFVAQLRIARCLWRMRGSQRAIVDAFKAAIEMCPDRAEPHYELARFFADHDFWQSAYDHAIQAARLARPTRTVLFLEAEVYDWRAQDLYAVAAFKCARFGESADASIALLDRGTLPEPERARVRVNVENALANASARASALHATPSVPPP